jgi:hypothetical protein
MIDANREVKDFILGLLELYRQHSSHNIAGVVRLVNGSPFEVQVGI